VSGQVLHLSSLGPYHIAAFDQNAEKKRSATSSSSLNFILAGNNVNNGHVLKV
jgi:hypothetical protein